MRIADDGRQRKAIRQTPARDGSLAPGKPDRRPPKGTVWALTMLTDKRQLGRTGLSLPPILFGTSCLGNLYQRIPHATKLAIAREWFAHVAPPVALDSAGKYGAGLALEEIGRVLSELGAADEQVVISNKLGWKRVPLKGPEPTFEPGAWVGIEHDAEQRIGADGIVECWRQGRELLGGRYRPQLVSVHDPDEYLLAASGPADRDRRLAQVVQATAALRELKAAGEVKAVGVGAKDWKVIRELTGAVELDWVMFACSLTVYTHPPELLDFIGQLSRRGVGIINSAVFNAGFLTGGQYFNYRRPDPAAEPDLFRWRERFLALCRRHRVRADLACVQFGLSAPAVAAVALNTSRPERIADNVRLVTGRAGGEFWADMKRQGLIDKDYPYL